MKLATLQTELDRLNSLEKTEATTNRIATIEARISLINLQIDELVELTGCRRSLLEKKHQEWIVARIEFEQRERGRHEQKRMRANASNATSNLANWE